MLLLSHTGIPWRALPTPQTQQRAAPHCCGSGAGWEPGPPRAAPCLHLAAHGFPGGPMTFPSSETCITSLVQSRVGLCPMLVPVPNSCSLPKVGHSCVGMVPSLCRTTQQAAPILWFCCADPHVPFPGASLSCLLILQFLAGITAARHSGD